MKALHIFHQRLEEKGVSGVIMTDFDYETLLNRARDNIPEDISSRARWRLPEPQIMIEGSNTILRNFTEVVGMMDRDDNHVYQYILNELGTSGSRDGPSRTLQRTNSTKAFEESHCWLCQHLHQVQSMFCAGYTLHQRRPYDAAQVSSVWCNSASQVVINPRIPSPTWNQSFHL